MKKNKQSIDEARVKKQMEEAAAAGYAPLLRRGTQGRSNTPSPWDTAVNAMLGTPDKNLLFGAGSKSTGMFASVGSEVPVSEAGTEGRGYIEWGLGNYMPNTIGLLTSLLPYTAAGVEFNATVAAGLGAVPKYRYQYYINSTIVTEEIDYSAAGELIQGKLLDAQKALADYFNSMNLVSSGKEKAAQTEVIAQMETQINKLKEDLDTWQTTNEEVETFLEQNNINLITTHLFKDMCHYDICFPELLLSRNADVKKTSLWTPKVTGIDYRSCHTTRLERMDDNGVINYAYISNAWLDNTIEAKDLQVAALPAIDPRHPYRSLEKKVRDYRLSRGSTLKGRPTRFVLPTYNPSVGRPYYPQPAWWSVFGGEIYSYASTIISDRATRKRNNNSFGRIIYVHLDYLEKLYIEQECKTSEDRAKVRDNVYSEIDGFLADCDNNGKPLYSYSFFPNGNQAQSIDAFRIIDLPAANKSETDANKTELEEVASIIFFAMQIHPDLIGAVPGRSGSSGGTYLREMHQHKQMMSARTQALVLQPFEVASRFNGWDTHLVWRIKQQTMTTLDRNKSGIEETSA